MLIFGMTGPIGHGKSTFAKAVRQLGPSSIHFESSLIISEVANALHASTRELPNRDDIGSINEWLRPLPSILMETVHAKATLEQIRLDIVEVESHPVEYEKLFLHIENLHRDPTLLRTAITRENKESFRPILQWLGGYLPKRVDPTIWYKEIMRRVYEAQSKGYKLCIIGGLRFPEDERLVRGSGGIIIKVYRPGHLQYDMLDPTERERDNIGVDCTVVSNGNIEELHERAKQVLDDLKNGRLQKVYYAHQQ